MFGAYRNDLDHDDLTPAPLPGGERRGAWKWHPSPPGPGGLLLENAHLLGGSLQFPDFAFRSKSGANIHMLTDPYNHLQPSLPAFAMRAVHAEADRNRTALQGCTQIDGHAYRKAVAPLSADMRGAVFGVATFSIADQAYIHQFDQHQTDQCPFCQKCSSTVPHVIFDCDHPKLVEARQNLSEDEKLAAVERHVLENSAALPPFLKHGIPPPLALMPDTPWWTNETPSELVTATNAAKNAFGIEDQGLGDKIFLNWLRPHAKFSAKTALLLHS